MYTKCTLCGENQTAIFSIKCMAEIRTLEVCLKRDRTFPRDINYFDTVCIKMRIKHVAISVKRSRDRDVEGNKVTYSMAP